MRLKELTENWSNDYFTPNIKLQFCPKQMKKKRESKRESRGWRKPNPKLNQITEEVAASRMRSVRDNRSSMLELLVTRCGRESEGNW